MKEKKRATDDFDKLRSYTENIEEKFFFFQGQSRQPTESPSPDKNHPTPTRENHTMKELEAKLDALGASYDHYKNLAGQIEEELNQKIISEDNLKETCEILENQLKQLRESEVLLRIKLEEANLSPISPVKGLSVNILWNKFLTKIK